MYSNNTKGEGMSFAFRRMSWDMKPMHTDQMYSLVAWAVHSIGSEEKRLWKVKRSNTQPIGEVTPHRRLANLQLKVGEDFDER